MWLYDLKVSNIEICDIFSRKYKHIKFLKWHKYFDKEAFEQRNEQ